MAHRFRDHNKLAHRFRECEGKHSDDAQTREEKRKRKGRQFSTRQNINSVVRVYLAVISCVLICMWYECWMYYVLGYQKSYLHLLLRTLAETYSTKHPTLPFSNCLIFYLLFFFFCFFRSHPLQWSMWRPCPKSKARSIIPERELLNSDLFVHVLCQHFLFCSYILRFMNSVISKSKRL